MKQALGNILENAVLAIPQDRKGIIRIKVSQVNSVILIAIEDNGIGMSDDAVSKIFKPFYSTRKAKGSGLGMTIAEKTIRDHRGTVAVSSEPDKGTQVTITLPLQTDPL